MNDVDEHTMPDEERRERSDRNFRLLFVLVVAVCALSTGVNTSIVLYGQGRITSTQGRLEAENTARRQLELCLTEWASTTTARTAALFAASQARSEALDELIGAVARGSTPRFERALRRYESVAHRYNALAKRHPVPPAPQFLCNQ